MERFDARIGRRALAWLVVAPPLAYALTLTLLAGAAAGSALTSGRVLLLLALAHGLPLAALVWMLTSVAAYSVTPGKLVAHSVVRDREYRLATGARPPRCERGVVRLESEGRRLSIRVADPDGCRAALAAATAAR